MGADTKLCRQAAFPGFALSAALRQLQACEASELTAAIATGTGVGMGFHCRCCICVAHGQAWRTSFPQTPKVCAA